MREREEKCQNVKANIVILRDVNQDLTGKTIEKNDTIYILKRRRSQ